MKHRNKGYQNVPFCDTVSHSRKSVTTSVQPLAMQVRYRVHYLRIVNNEIDKNNNLEQDGKGLPWRA